MADLQIQYKLQKEGTKLTLKKASKIVQIMKVSGTCNLMAAVLSSVHMCSRFKRKLIQDVMVMSTFLRALLFQVYCTCGEKYVPTESKLKGSAYYSYGKIRSISKLCTAGIPLPNKGVCGFY